MRTHSQWLALDRAERGRLTAAVACLAALTGMTTLAARAEDVTFAVIGPHEYDLPVNFNPFNVIVQYGEWNDGATQYNASGNEVNGPGSHLWVGLTKYVRFWTWPSIPGVGFAYEVIQPEVRITTSDSESSGFGDTLTGPAVWIKPTPQTTLGLQSFLQIPIGNTEVSNHYWANYTSMFFDYQHPMMSVTGDLGAVFRSTYHNGSSPEINEGTTFHFNVRVGYPNRSFVEPFVGLDWQSTNPSHYVDGGKVEGTGEGETAGGAGLLFKIGTAASISLRYSHTLTAHNTPQTNAGYLKFAYVW